MIALLSQVRPFSPAGLMPEVIGDVATIKGFEAIFNNVVSVALGFAAIVFFFVLIASGFSYMFAGGEPQKLQQARSGLTVAFLGLIIVILALLIIRFVSLFSGNTGITTFSVIGP